MEWLDTTALESVLRQAPESVELTAPQNPSSLMLTLVGVATMILFDVGRRSLDRRAERQAKSRTATVASKPQRAA